MLTAIARGDSGVVLLLNDDLLGLILMLKTWFIALGIIEPRVSWLELHDLLLILLVLRKLLCIKANILPLIDLNGAPPTFIPFLHFMSRKRLLSSRRIPFI